MNAECVIFGHGLKRVRVWLEGFKRGTVEEITDGTVTRSKQVKSPEYTVLTLVESGWQNVTR